MSSSQRDTERLEVLAGERRGGRETMKGAAVRIEDMLGLLEMPSALKSSKAASNPPTQAEYDALREDVEMIRMRLAVVAQALTRRLLL